MDTKKVFQFDETEEFLWAGLGCQDRDNHIFEHIKTLTSNCAVAFVLVYGGYTQYAPLIGIGVAYVVLFSLQGFMNMGKNKKHDQAYVNIVKKVEAAWQEKHDTDQQAP